MILAASLVSEYVVPVEPLLVTIVDQLVPPLVDLSIVYPVIAEPPLFLGAAQDRLICVDEIAVDVSALGELGTVGAVNVVAESALDGVLIPAPLIADMR